MMKFTIFIDRFKEVNFMTHLLKPFLVIPKLLRFPLKLHRVLSSFPPSLDSTQRSTAQKINFVP